MALCSNLKDLSPSDPQAVLSAMLQAVGEGRFTDLAQHFTEDAELPIHGFPAIDGAWHGVAAVVAAMAANFSLISQQKPVGEGMIRQGDAFAIKIRETGELTRGHFTLVRVFRGAHSPRRRVPSRGAGARRPVAGRCR